jgi:hypothetical protein
VPYSKASDDKKVERNWNKTRGLFNRGEYSVAVIRCGTCVELAVNFAVRQELVIERDLPLSFVDNLLKNANGLRNKYQSIYLPIMADCKKYDSLRKLWKNKIEKINKDRNAVVHSGEFRSGPVARKVMQATHEVLQAIMNLYQHKARFKNIET